MQPFFSKRLREGLISRAKIEGLPGEGGVLEGKGGKFDCGIHAQGRKVFQKFATNSKIFKRRRNTFTHGERKEGQRTGA